MRGQDLTPSVGFVTSRLDCNAGNASLCRLESGTGS